MLGKKQLTTKDTMLIGIDTAVFGVLSYVARTKPNFLNLLFYAFSDYLSKTDMFDFIDKGPIKDAIETGLYYFVIDTVADGFMYNMKGMESYTFYNYMQTLAGIAGKSAVNLIDEWMNKKKDESLIN